MSKKTAWKVFPFIFIGVAALSLIAAGIMIAVMMRFRLGAVKTEAEVIYSYQAGFSLHFTAKNGKEYYVPPGFDSTSMRPGDKMTVYYDPDNPNRIQAAPIIWFSAIPGGISLIFFCVGIGFGIPTWRSNRIRKELLVSGQRRIAEISDLRPNLSISINNSHPYNIYCRYTDRYGELHTFRSENLWFNPEEYLRRNNITTLPVYMDGDDYKRYYVDVEMLAL